MKSVFYALALTIAAWNPVGAIAQNGPVTRAAVRQQLVALENAGYSPSEKDPYYPNKIQAAEARVSASHRSSVGGEANGTTAVGTHGISSDDYQAMYGRP